MGAQDQRPRFYEGQYLAANDLAAIVEYLRAADARHALGAHTWGIAIGLYLVERPAAGAAQRREIILTPGVAWDGFGRPIVVTRPTRLPEELFSTIPYEENLDGVNPKGRAVRVWLTYKEIAARQPAPGFESCGEDDQNARVAETFDFVVGAVAAGPNRQGNIVVGTETLQAEEALRRFDSPAQPLYDASVPHQSFPSSKQPPRWLVPVGLVRWVAREDDLGYFASREGVPEYRLEDCTRAFRRYIGAVVENLVAADGAIVLQRRGANPRECHKLAYLLNCGRKSEELLDDLAWIEGNLRVVGDAKIAGGKLLMRDADGDDEGVPIYLERSGDDPSLGKKTCCEDLDAAPGAAAAAAAELAKAPREFRAAIGNKGQNANRFIVGPEVAADAAKGEKASLAPRFVVLSGTGEKDNKDTEGRAGVNTRDPNAALEVKGDWNGQDGAIRVSGTQPTIRFEGGADVSDAKWIAQLSSNPKGAYRIAYRTTAPAWKGVINVLPEKVGIRSDAPSAPLTVRADGDAEDLVAFEDKGGSAKWKIRLKPDDHSGLTFTEISGNRNCVFLKPGGDVGIGTTDPQGRLTVYGKVQPAQGSVTLFSSSADFEYDGGDDKLFIFKDTGGKTAFMGTRLGVGTTTPRARLEIMGTADLEGTAMFRPDPAKGSNVSHAHWDTTGDWYIRSAASNGKVILQDTGGNVGIGTSDPQQKLHVKGTFVLVEGAGGELAYIGGDSSTGFLIGSPLGDWFDDLARKLNGLTDAEKVMLVVALAAAGLVAAAPVTLALGPVVFAAATAVLAAAAIGPAALAAATAVLVAATAALVATGLVATALVAAGLPAVFTVAFLIALKENPDKIPLLDWLADRVGVGARPAPPSPTDTMDVQIGSLNSKVHMVHFWNASGSPDWMDVVCRNIIAVSDARAKTNIEPLTGALGTVCRLRGVRFDWRQDAEHARAPRSAMGVIAQEVAQVAPHMVRKVRGSLGVAYNEFVPLLIEAVKELKAEVDELRAQVEKSAKRRKKSPGE